MEKQEIIEKAKALCTKCADSLGFKILDVDYVFENGINILRVIGDSDNGFGIDEATSLNEAISLALDNDDFIDDEYYLEVSSEGLEKELRTLDDVKNSVGEYIYCEFKEKVSGLNEVYGDFLSFNDGILEIRINQKGRIKNINVTMDNVSFIRLAIKF